VPVFSEAKAPLRLGFAGGGTDVPPYPEKFGGNVLNATIAKYASTRISLVEAETSFLAKDISTNAETVKSGINESALPLHQATYDYFLSRDDSLGKLGGLKVETFVDAPIGSGLGSSSALVVSMVSAFGGIIGAHLEPRQIAEIAFEIERIHCGFEGGQQDQYAAAFGGLNFMTFRGGNDVEVTPLTIEESVLKRLSDELFVYFSGDSRKSAEIISTQVRNTRDPNGSGLRSMHLVKEEATLVRDALVSGDFDELYLAVRRGWEAKKSTSSSISSERLDAIVDGAIELGAGCGKVSGAGGGGFILFMLPSESQNTTKRFLNGLGGSLEKVKVENKGVQLWTK
jgi:D-glycero-alpha-D-manno-heptose-7-phosphate kinase